MSHVLRPLHEIHGWWQPSCSCGWRPSLLHANKRQAVLAWRRHRYQATEPVT